MADSSMDAAALSAKQAQDADMVQLKMQVDRLRSDLTPGPSKQQKLRKACTDFEAVFISKIWEQMRATVPKGGYLNSPQQDMYRSMFDRDFAEKLAGDGGFGLGDMLYGQLKQRMQASGKADGAAAVQTVVQAAAQAPVAAPAKTALESRQLKPPKRAPQVQAQAPERPASVPGEVMADVEALARRIEAAYDKKTLAAETAAAGSGRRLAVIG